MDNLINHTIKEIILDESETSEWTQIGLSIQDAIKCAETCFDDHPQYANRMGQFLRYIALC